MATIEWEIHSITTNMSSTLVLLLPLSILLMDSSSFISLIILCSILKYHLVHSDDDSPHASSATVETQYLTYDMSQYGVEGGVFSSQSAIVSVFSLVDTGFFSSLFRSQFSKLLSTRYDYLLSIQSWNRLSCSTRTRLFPNSWCHSSMHAWLFRRFYQCLRL